MSETLSHRLSIAAIFASAITAALPGCRSQAHSDLYRQRMASEIRVLEDQLYEADYQNRVLRDSLERRAAATSADTAAAVGEEASKGDASADLPSLDDIDIGQGFDPTDELSLPSFDEGERVDPDTLSDPGIQIDPGESGDEGDSRGEMLPAPGGPEPPGRGDTEEPQIDPGKPLPPAATEEGQLKPPGQVVLPDSVQAAAGVPEKLRIHPGLSGGHRVEGQPDGMMIVVNAVDKLGKMVSLENFDVDAELTIVILDPNLEPAKARIGRWDFSEQQVAKFLRSEPISGLHVPIAWSDKVPSGEEVIVHVRLRAEADEMRCEARLKVDKETAIAEWTPRGDDLR